MTRTEIGESHEYDFFWIDHEFANSSKTKINYGRRNHHEKVTFKQPFTQIPKVIVGFSKIDTDKEFNTRVGVQPLNITKHGFIIETYTWWTTKFYKFKTM